MTEKPFDFRQLAATASNNDPVVWEEFLESVILDGTTMASNPNAGISNSTMRLADLIKLPAAPERRSANPAD